MMFGKLRSHTANPNEIMIVTALLSRLEPEQAAALTKQFSTPGRVKRTIAGSTLEVELVSTTEDLLVDLAGDVTSPDVQVRDVLSGGVLWFSVSLRRGGFFGVLKGRAMSEWPRRWQVDPDDLERARSAAAWPAVPSDTATLALSSYLEIPLDLVRRASLFRSAEPDEILALEAREGLQLPLDLKEVLGITDGFSLGDVAVFGVRDAYLVDLGDGVHRWHFASDDSGAQFLCTEAGVISVPDLESTPTAASFCDTSVRGWLSKIFRE